jgi:hypothetical protein
VSIGSIEFSPRLGRAVVRLIPDDQVGMGPLATSGEGVDAADLHRCPVVGSLVVGHDDAARQLFGAQSVVRLGDELSPMGNPKT